MQLVRNKSGLGNIYINSYQDVADFSVYFDENMDLIKTIRKGGK